MSTMPRTRSYFEVLSEQYQRESYEEYLNLGRVQPLVLVWGLALDNGKPHIIDFAEENVLLELRDVWGADAEASFNREKRVMLCRHSEGFDKTFYASQISVEGLEK